MRIVYLDQNHWVKIAQARKFPSKHPKLQELLVEIQRAVIAGTLCLPLAAANIYETYKINRRERRIDLALVQCELSQGNVFVGRHQRLANEIASFARAIFGLPLEDQGKHWFLSKLFFESIAEHGDERLPFKVSEAWVRAINENPSFFLFDYLVGAPDEERQFAVRRWSAESNELRQRVEDRRRKSQDESIKMRRRIYGAELALNELEIILKIAREAGAPWQSVSDIGALHMRQLIRYVPSYYIERELALKIESLCRPIEENDFRDMETFCATVPYADCVISENLFVNLARQARLDQHFETAITTDLMKIADYL